MEKNNICPYCKTRLLTRVIGVNINIENNIYDKKDIKIFINQTSIYLARFSKNRENILLCCCCNTCTYAKRLEKNNILEKNILELD